MMNGDHADSTVKGWITGPGLPWLVGLLLVLIALLARLPGIQSRPLWYDEAFSVLFSRTGPGVMLQATLNTSTGSAAEEHPLLFYILLWGWMHVFGSSVLTLRMLSVLISLIEVGVIWIFMREVFTLPTALIAGALVALSPFQIQYGQEVRMYGLMSLWIVICAWMAWRGTRGDRWRDWIIFGLSAALAMYSLTLAVIFLVPIACTPFLLKRPGRWKRMAIALCLALLLYLPWGIQLPQQLAKIGSGFWIEPPSLSSLLQTGLGFVTGLPLSGAALALGLFASLTIYSLSAVQANRREARGGMQRLEGNWLLFLAIAPIFLLFVISLWRPIYLLRALLPAGGFFLLWLAYVWTGAGVSRSGKYLILVVLAAAFIIGDLARITYRGFPYAPYRSIADYILFHGEPGDKVVHANKISFLPEVYYAPELNQSYLADPESSGSNTLAPATQRALGLMAEPDVELAAGGAERVYFLVFRQELEDYQDLGGEVHPALQWLQANYLLIEVTPWDDLQMYVFEKPSPSASRHGVVESTVQ
jgi:mannosyltransferase